MRIKLLIPTLLLLLLLTSCYRPNPSYCRDDGDCGAGRLCGPLKECIDAADQGSPPDQAAPDQAAPRDLAPAPCPACNCTGNTPAACTCASMASCPITCADDCPLGLTCRDSTNCALTCGDRCTKELLCERVGSCMMTCGAGCLARCQDTAACTLRVGSGARVRCVNGPCTVTCTGACSVEGMPNTSNITLTCPADQPKKTCMPTVLACGACPQ